MITIFTTNTCAYCKTVKEFLTKRGFTEFEEVNLDNNPERRKEAIEISGQMAVPVIVVENNGQKRVSVGFNPGKLIEITNGLQT